MISTDEFMHKDRFARHTGIELLEISPGRAKARMEIREDHKNGMGVAHGGAIFTLADLVFAAASNSHGIPALAVNVSISYLKKVSDGILTAEAAEISLNPKLASYTVEVRDENRELVAIFQGMVYRKTGKK
ncbi:MAG: hotdog fold thioesterase [Desulfobacterales bacterium]